MLLLLLAKLIQQLGQSTLPVLYEQALSAIEPHEVAENEVGEVQADHGLGKDEGIVGDRGRLGELLGRVLDCQGQDEELEDGDDQDLQALPGIVEAQQSQSLG